MFRSSTKGTKVIQMINIVKCYWRLMSALSQKSSFEFFHYRWDSLKPNQLRMTKIKFFLKKRRNCHSIQNVIKWVPVFSLDNSLIWDFDGTWFWQKIAPNRPSSTLWSGNVLADSCVETQFDGIPKKEHIPLFVCCLFDGITAWSSGKGITAFIYY